MWARRRAWQLLDGLDWITKEDDRLGSEYDKKINTIKVPSWVNRAEPDRRCRYRRHARHKDGVLTAVDRWEAVRAEARALQVLARQPRPIYPLQVRRILGRPDRRGSTRRFWNQQRWQVGRNCLSCSQKRLRIVYGVERLATLL